MKAPNPLDGFTVFRLIAIEPVGDLRALVGTTIPHFRPPVAGLPMAHWRHTLPPESIHPGAQHGPYLRRPVHLS